MNLQSVFEELNKLYESVEKPVEEEEVVEQEADELTEEVDSVEEGIFDSKAKKEANYTAALNAVLDDTPNNVIADICDQVEDFLSKVSGDDAAKVKQVMKSLSDTLSKDAGNNPVGKLATAMLQFDYDTEKLEAVNDALHAVQKKDAKNGVKARTYFNTMLSNKLTKCINSALSKMTLSEAVEEEPEEAEEIVTQYVLECTNCGGIIVKQDINVAEDGTAEVEEACQYCEAENSYKVIGTMMPYEAAEEEAEEEEIEIVDDDEIADEEIQDEPVEEGFFGVDIPVTANVNVKADGNNVPVMNTGI